MDSEKIITIKEIQEKLSEILNDEYSVQVYMVLKDKDAITIRLADIEQGETYEELNTMFCGYLKEEIIDREDADILELSISEKRDGALYYYDYDEYPGIMGYIHSFDIKRAVNSYTKFNFETDKISLLYGYIIYIGSMERGVTLFKRHYHISLIKRETFLMGLIRDKKRFVKMDTCDIIRLNKEIQIMCLDSKMYVTNMDVLKNISEFDKLIIRDSGIVINAIEELKLLEDIQVLKDAAEDIAFARKLSKVKKTSPIFVFNIPKDTIIDFIKQTDVLKNRIKFSDDGQKIRLDTKKSKEAFLSLMNDSILRSELTNLYYNAVDKSKLS